MIQLRIEARAFLIITVRMGHSAQDLVIQPWTMAPQRYQATMLKLQEKMDIAIATYSLKFVFTKAVCANLPASICKPF